MPEYVTLKTVMMDSWPALETIVWALKKKAS